MWRWLASVEEDETPVLHRLEDGTGYLCWHHNEGSSSSLLECWCCWRHGGDYQIHGSFVFVPSGCPPHRCPRQHILETRLATYVLYMARTRSVHSHGTFWQRLAISLDPVYEQGKTIWSTILTLTSGADSDFGTTASKHSIKSDLLVWCIMPFDANDGGQAWFNVRRRHPYHCLWFDTICTSFRRDAHQFAGCRFWKWTLSVSFLT